MFDNWETSEDFNVNTSQELTAVTPQEVASITTQDYNTQTEKLRKSKKFKISRNIRDAVHEAVTNLKELGNIEWDYTMSFLDNHNQSINNRIFQFVQKGNPRTHYNDIMEACKVYFNTRKYKAKEIQSNTHILKQKKQRKRQRQTTLRMRRLASLKRMGNDIQPDIREKLEIALKGTTYISSEESEEDTSNTESQEKCRRLVVRRLGWRSDFLNYWFSVLDSESPKGASALTRVISTENSERPMPPPFHSLSWAISQNKSNDDF